MTEHAPVPYKTRETLRDKVVVPCSAALMTLTECCGVAYLAGLQGQRLVEKESLSSWLELGLQHVDRWVETESGFHASCATFKGRVLHPQACRIIMDDSVLLTTLCSGVVVHWFPWCVACIAQQVRRCVCCLCRLVGSTYLLNAYIVAHTIAPQSHHWLKPSAEDERRK